MTKKEATARGRKNLGKLAVAGGAVAVGALLVTNFAGLAAWQKTITGEGTVIQGGTMSAVVSPEYKVYDVSSGDTTKYREIDPKTFALSPGDTLRIVQGLDITVEGTNLAAQLTGESTDVQGVLPVHTDLRLLTGTADPIGGNLHKETLGSSSDGTLANIPMNFTGTRHYQMSNDIVFGLESDLSSVNVEALVAGPRWTLTQVAVDRETAWTIADPVLNKAIHKHLNYPLDQRLNVEDAAKFNFMPNLTQAEKEQITTLAGMEKMTNLKSLNLSDMKITSVKPLAKLPNLTSVIIRNSTLEDLTGLSEIPKLSSLELAATKAVDFTPLVGSTKLTNLTITDTTATSLDGLESLTTLRQFFLSGAPNVQDYDALSSLVNIEMATLVSTSISDLSPLANMNKVRNLNLMGSAGVVDLSPLRLNTSIDTLFISNTGVTDLSPLTGNTALRRIFAANTPVQNWAGLDTNPLITISK